MATTYILYSLSLDKYYTGSTENSINNSLSQHNTNHKGFTGKANDWFVVFAKTFDTLSESRNLERIIKKNGAKRYLERL